MALSTYTELKAAVADYLARSDLTSPIVDAIRMVESRLNYGGDAGGTPMKPLRIRQMENTSYASMVAATESLTLPTDFLAVRTVKITSENPDRALQFMTPEIQDERYGSDTTGTPESFSIVGTAYRFRPVPNTAFVVRNDYYQAIPALASNASNWLLAAAPHIYLYGALMEMREYMIDREDATRMSGRFMAAVKALRDGDRDARYGGSIQMRPQWVY